MRIIQVVPNFPPSIGGVQNCAKELSYGLAKKGHDVIVMTSDCRSGENKLIGGDNIKINYLKTIWVAHTPIIPSLFVRLLVIPKNSIIHLHISKAFIPEIVYLISKIRNIPYVAHFHLDVGPSGIFGFLLPFYKNIFLKRILRSAAKVIVLNSNYIKVIKEKYGIQKNVFVIPNGVSDRFFWLRKKRNLSKPVNLLYIGRLSVQKAIDRLIRALPLLKNKAVLHIVGEGELETELRKLVLTLKLKNVIIEGPKKGEALLEFYRRADIFVLASRQEGLPLVLLEAMASGIPVIASDVVGNHEYVGAAGILVSPQTPEKFAGEIDRLIDNKSLYEKLAQEGIKKSQKLNWPKIIHKFEKVYSQVSK